ncbi:MAG: DUF5655 domain-containing protein [Gemmatimonadota bacterium]|nr:DUF5655 domain-containing protein [Gemmatimonadota bacterium]
MHLAADELWTCPACGHRFVTKNMWHSCSNFTLESHFERCTPQVRATFDAFLAVVEACGEVVVIPQKTRIAIQAQVRFARCVVRRNWLLTHLWLTRRVLHPRLTRTEKFGDKSYGHHFRFDAPADIDADFSHLVAEAYRVGLREHLDR